VAGGRFCRALWAIIGGTYNAVHSSWPSQRCCSTCTSNAVFICNDFIQGAAAATAAGVDGYRSRLVADAVWADQLWVTLLVLALGWVTNSWHNDANVACRARSSRDPHYYFQFSTNYICVHLGFPESGTAEVAGCRELIGLGLQRHDVCNVSSPPCIDTAWLYTGCNGRRPWDDQSVVRSSWACTMLSANACLSQRESHESCEWPRTLGYSVPFLLLFFSILLLTTFPSTEPRYVYFSRNKSTTINIGQRPEKD